MKIPLPVFCLLLLLPLSAQAADDSATLVSRFMQAWNANDPKALGALYAADGDLVTPDGTVLRGPENTAKFYTMVFARGYQGTKGTSEVFAVRDIAPDIKIVDAKFAISGIHAADGSARPDETGIMAAVIVRQNGEWKIAALRENTAAKSLNVLSLP